MPNNVRMLPWKPTQDQQDFIEELYLNVTSDMVHSRDASMCILPLSERLQVISSSEVTWTMRLLVPY
jgi:hypothetical protein